MERAVNGARLDWRFLVVTTTRIALPVWFALDGAVAIQNAINNDAFGLDVRLYRNAAVAALSGGNPWAIQPDGHAFAGPPSTLLFYLPTGLIPLPLATVLVMGLGVFAGIVAIRSLRLAPWWLMFPPLFGAMLVGNADAVVLALLLVSGRLAGLAAVLKVYAFIPLLLQRRWNAVILGLIVSALSLPLLPMFLANLGTVSTVLDEQTGGLSAWGTWLMLPTIAALYLLRRQGAEWLVVPAMWPNSQDHYATISLPAVHRDRVAAAIIGLNYPLAPVAAVLVMAIRTRWAGSSRGAIVPDV